VNLHAIASPIIQAVNPSILVTVRISTGYATGADGTRTPVYDDVADVRAQIQSLTAGDLQLIDGLNIQGTQRAIYLFGKFDGLNRQEQKGGDLIIYPDGTEWPYGTVWKVNQVIEQWPGWCKVAVTQQIDRDN